MSIQCVPRPEDEANTPHARGSISRIAQYTCMCIILTHSCKIVREGGGLPCRNTVDTLRVTLLKVAGK